MANNKRLIYAEDALVGLQYISMFGDVNDNMIQGAMRLARSKIENAPTVDAVEAEKYNRLLEMYHELRENFVDFVCSGIPNVAPYCLNRCDGCCDAYGWCRQSTLCQGFNPAEVIVDAERKQDGK